MIRSIEAHLALKKLRESVPEVNAPEFDANDSIVVIVVRFKRQYNSSPPSVALERHRKPGP